MPSGVNEMSNVLRCVGAVLLLLIGAVIPAGATEFHVSPSASSGGNGSSSNPWLLKTALQSSTVQPGDTVTLAAGTYLNPTTGQDAVAWVCTLQGTSPKPIIVRAARGTRVILDGADTKQNGIFRVSSSYVWYWGLEIMSSDPGRVDAAPQTDANNLGSYPDVNYIKRGTGIDMSSGGSPTGNKFINCSIHDCFNGFGSTNTNDNTQLYGCLLYNNGWYNSGGGGRSHHGHNIYIHNATGEIKQFIDCITWGAFENNIQAWSGSAVSNSETNDFYFDGLVSFMYGAQVDGSSLLLGNLSPTNPTVTNSMFYQPGGASSTIDFGYNQGSGTIAAGNVSNNYIDAGEIYFNAAFSGTTFANNFITSGYVRGSVPSGSGNTVTSSRPTANKVFVRPSQYEPGRANVVVYNWQGGSSVTVDMSSVLKTGDTYNIVDVQNPSAVLLSGTYSGSVSIPMTGTTAAQPVGNSPEGRTHTTSEFGAYVVINTASSAPTGNVNLKVKYCLQGPYLSSTNTMSNALKNDGQLASHFGASTIPASAVDSVTIEIRNTATAPTMRAFAPAWLLTDGSIRAYGDTTKNYVSYPGVPAGNYYVVVGHRNHVSVMSFLSVAVDGGVPPTVYDFSTGQGQAYGTNAMIQTGTHFSLISGVSNNSDQVINASDRVASRNNLGASNYNAADVNMDGVVNASDRVVERTNLGLSSQVP
jgi:hypothetical protein